MRYDEYPPDQSNDLEPRDEKRKKGVDVGLAVLGLTVAVGLSVYLLRDQFGPDRSDNEVAVQSENASAPAVAYAPEQPAAIPVEDVELKPSPADQLREAQAQVESLQTELSARDAELTNIKAEIAKRDASDESARIRYRERQVAVQHEIDGLKTALAMAQDERDTLRKDLKEALAEVDRQVVRNKKLTTTAVAYKEASGENLWFAFTNNAKVRICDRGTYRRRESCEADLDAFFDAEQRTAFTNCVNTAQAIPMLWEAEDDTVPSNARKIDARDRERRDDWYVVYCDPTLPENAPKDITEETPQVFAMLDR